MTAIRILHVDDEADIREVVELSLGLDPGFEIRACASGADALVVAAAWSPSFILLDIVMPGMDGLTTFESLRKDPRTAHIPVMFLTARPLNAEVEQLIALGARGALAKPFDPMKLAALVRNQLAHNPILPEYAANGGKVMKLTSEVRR